MLGRVKRSYRAPFSLAPRGVRAKYDSAQTTAENRRHWALADSLSAVAANNLAVRMLLRNRARYEVGNNSYAQGIIETYADDIVGTGPRLQLRTPNAAANREIEAQFRTWCEKVHLAETLHTLTMSRTTDGESFAVFTTNPQIDHPVQLDVMDVECDQFTAPVGTGTDKYYVDGIRFDRFRNPLSYDMLRDHPGGPLGIGGDGAETLEAKQVIHLFRRRRPGQVRGYPDITPALPLYGNMRRFTLAVLAAAEAAADHAGVIEAQVPPEEVQHTAPLEEIELEARMFTTLPAGWKLSQLDAKQPTTTYPEFKHEIVNEIARCLSMPYNIAAGNSASYNYSSGRLDHKTYYKRIRIERHRLTLRCLERIFFAWLDEAALIPGLIPAGLGPFYLWPHAWFWDGDEHVDPQKEATAQGTRLGNLTTSLAEECAKEGKDWEEHIDQLVKEAKKLKEGGLTPAWAQPQAAATTPEDELDNEEDDDEVADKAPAENERPTPARRGRAQASAAAV